MPFSIITTALLVTILSTALHFLWYGNMAFGKIWRKTIKRKPDAKIPNKFIIISAILWFITASLYGFASYVLGVSQLVDYIIFSLVMGIAFTLPVRVMSALYGGFDKKLIFIDIGFYFCAYIIMAITTFLVGF